MAVLLRSGFSTPPPSAKGPLFPLRNILTIEGLKLVCLRVSIVARAYRTARANHPEKAGTGIRYAAWWIASTEALICRNKLWLSSRGAVAITTNWGRIRLKVKLPPYLYDLRDLIHYYSMRPVCHALAIDKA